MSGVARSRAIAAPAAQPAGRPPWNLRVCGFTTRYFALFPRPYVFCGRVSMNRIEKLMAQMTLQEKLGQLTMTAAGYAVTGPVIAGDSTEAIRSGAIGNLLNLVGPGPVREMQRLAVEHSRLRIPLLIGLDIIHGHRPLFPIPLAEAALFDPQTWELTAREAAREGTADGLAMTFSPMVDVSRDTPV